ncbi:hypothetical protein KFK09_011990 [Dendrobium nobile]|uniref:Uncharacterized protein n=1 Tax=Dendrobium nobile TaxID=94219 RepID=A0A8T3BGD9_DENNO|nr:hypothetical protein KFK09_011990 [Dendrobium nobile]
MASPEKQDDKKKISTRAKKHSKAQKQDSKPGSSRIKLSKSGISSSQKVGPKKQTAQNKLIPQYEKANMVNGAAKVSNKSVSKRKKSLPKLKGSYSLRSLDRGRVLRSKLSTAKCKTTMNPGSNTENLVTRKKKVGKKKIKKSGQDELSRVKKHIRYMLNRMNYEQSLIDAYSGEGWKGQSAEKLRPEKELERAKSEILRCKLKIREIFKHLESLLAEGRLQESLFDPDGIDSEDIFCGKCGSKEVSADNDIILCDGVCERGFHQKCLNPPLLSEDIPTGDEGWLCPQCDCKVECIDLLSEFRGTDLSIEDSWERIFPEAAVLANGNGQYDDLNLPSDDSEDDDYKPEAQVLEVDDQEEGSGESDSSSSCYDSTSSDDNRNQATVELPTDDSEDDDYDPDAVDPDKEIQKSKSSSDESDFTSDSDEFCAELKKISYAEEASSCSQPNLEFFVDSGRDEMKDKDKIYDYYVVPSAMLDIDKQESGLSLSNKRGRERLDYKKLYDEAYGKSSSDSSDDEDWTEMSSPKKLKKTDDQGIEVDNDIFVKVTPKLPKKIASSSAVEKDHGPQEPSSSGRSSATVLRNSEVASKKLSEYLKKNQYPTKKEKESLAQELSMTYKQVTKWFDNARHSSRVSSKQSSKICTATSKEVSVHCDTPASHSEPDKGAAAKSPLSSKLLKATYKKKLDEAFQESQYPSKEKKEELAQELGMTFRKVSRWFETARRRYRSKESSNPCRTPGSHNFDIDEEEKTTGASTPDTLTNAKPDNRVSPLDKVSTPTSSTSPWRHDHEIDLDSPIANGAASNAKEKKAAVDDRQKAIAKELRRMRRGR